MGANQKGRRRRIALGQERCPEPIKGLIFISVSRLKVASRWRLKSHLSEATATHSVPGDHLRGRRNRPPLFLVYLLLKILNTRAIAAARTMMMTPLT
jgi:hypothetical protein